VLLGLLCGVAAGAVGTGWATARETSVAFPRFVERAGAGGFFITCDEAVAAECGRQYPPKAVRDVAAGVPGVAAAARAAAVVGQTRIEGREPALGLFVLYAEPPGSLSEGSGRLLAGDQLTPKRPGDIVVNESAARSSDISVGDRITFTPYLADQSDAANGGVAAHGPPLEGRVVGIVRQPIDLAADSAESKSANFGSAEMVVPPAWWASEPDVYRYGTGVATFFERGADPADTRAAVVDALRPRNAQFETESSDDVATVYDAIDYQVWGARLFAIVIALAGLILLGQAIGRQVARENKDADVLRALGVTRAQRALASGMRWAVAGFFAAFVGVAIMYVASPIAPIGLARKTIEHAQFDLDDIVAFVIALATLLAVTAGGAWSAWRMDSRRAHPVPSSSLGIRSGQPAATTGIIATLQSLRRPLRTNSATALGAIVLVATAAIASVAVVQSYDDLLDHPARFGAPWDAVVGNNSSPEEAQSVADTLARINGIKGAAGIVDLDGQRVGRESVPMIAFVRAGDLPETISPAITAGRAPTGPGEAALGAVTMRRLGLKVGDDVRIEVPDTKVGELRVRVVGRAVLNNTYGLEPGTGGVIAGSWATELIRGEGSEPSPQQLAVQIDPDANRARVLDALRDAFPESFSAPLPSTGLRNLGRIRTLPWTLVGMLALLAGGVALQALLASIRRRRHDLAVLRAIGFTARNGRASLRWQVGTLSLLAAAISIPFGVLVGRLLWHLIAQANGLAMEVDIPIAVVAMIAGLAFALPVALIAVPAWLELRHNAASVLRTE
jgi:ABC-type lipoprotein release transport system permease subunit